MNRNKSRILPGAIAAGVGVILLASAASGGTGIMPVARGQPAVEGYNDYAAYQAALKSIAASRFATLRSLARTRAGREVFLLSIATGKPDDKPALLIVGNVHPPYLLASELAVRLARQAVDQAESDPDVRKLLDRVTLYVIPRPSPDASEAFFRKPYHERALNERPIDDDADGQVDEDGPDDLNGDGLITVMRVEDTGGPYLPHPDDDRILIKADPKKNESGRYAVYVEGRDNDLDGEQGEDPSGGTAFNRNFTFNYPYFASGAGPHQVSEAESRAVADFAFSHPNIVAVLTFTPEDNLMKVWKTDADAEKSRIKTTLLSADAPYVERVAKMYREIHSGKHAPEPPAGEGSFSDWAYFHYGRWSFACRGWWIPKVEPGEEEEEAGEDGEEKEADEEEQPGDEGEAKEKTEEDDEEPSGDRRGADEINALAWFDENGIDGFVDWQPIEHPDFPDRKVEVGGFKPFLRDNPPASQIEPLAEKHWKFARQLVEMFPRLTIPKVKAEPLGSGVWRVTADVVNEGRLPTVSQMGRITREHHRLQMEISLPRGVSLVTGHNRVDIGVLAAEGGRAEKTWLVQAPAEKPVSLRIRVWSPSVGSQVNSVKLVPEQKANK